MSAVDPAATDPAAQSFASGGGDVTNGQKSEAEERRENNRSAVRMIVTYVAAGFLFVVGAAIAGYLIATGKNNEGKDVFLAILPIAAAIVTYWFATRKNEALTPDGVAKIMEASRVK